eukprot:gene11310-7842_t
MDFCLNIIIIIVEGKNPEVYRFFFLSDSHLQYFAKNTSSIYRLSYYFYLFITIVVIISFYFQVLLMLACIDKIRLSIRKPSTIPSTIMDPQDFSVSHTTTLSHTKKYPSLTRINPPMDISRKKELSSTLYKVYQEVNVSTISDEFFVSKRIPMLRKCFVRTTGIQIGLIAISYNIHSNTKELLAM